MWISFFLLFFTWTCYLPLLYLISLVKSKRNKDPDIAYKARLSFVIAAHNEESRVEKRIDNILEISYPRDLVEIIVASDGSTDGTDSIVERISREQANITLLRFATQKGRAHVHNESVKKAKGDIIIFTDAETRFKPDFVKALMPHFSDPDVGCVSGRLYYENIGQSSITMSAGIYWKYEELMRRLESDLDLLAFGTGAGLAVRKEAYVPIEITADIDCAATLNAKLRGYKVKYETKAELYDHLEAHAKRSSAARIRKTSLAFKDVLTKLLKINFFKRPMLFCSVFFHKTSRHLTFLYMVVIFVTNTLLLRKGGVYPVFFTGQVLFYVFALIGWALEKRNKKISLFYIPFNFVLVNVSRSIGVCMSLFGRDISAY
jgi:cellulose synthase/poly-beta-1,6-N-acetylglucosamine synthase-like glycosyltransferase